MIQYECNKGEIKLKAEGSVQELGADIATLIHSLHADIASRNLIEGLLFEYLIKSQMEVIFSPFEGDAEMLKHANVSEVVDDEK